jgi:hypothetical protein
MARAWPLRAVRLVNKTGWIIEEFKIEIISQSELLISFGSWGASQLEQSLPSAKCIFGMFAPPMLI